MPMWTVMVVIINGERFSFIEAMEELTRLRLEKTQQEEQQRKQYKL